MKQLILVLVCQMALLANAQNVGIGITIPNASSILDVNSTSKGMLTPRMSSAQRAAIASPAKGLLVFDPDTNTFWFYNGGSWEQMIASGGAGLSLPYNGSVSNPGIAFRIGNNGTGTAIEGSSVSGNGVYANSFSGTALNAYSTNGAGIISTSTNNSAIIASTSGGNPAVVINATVQNLTEALRVSGYNTAVKVTTALTNGTGIYSETLKGAAIMAKTTNEDINGGYGLWAISGSGAAVYALTTMVLFEQLYVDDALQKQRLRQHLFTSLRQLAAVCAFF